MFTLECFHICICIANCVVSQVLFVTTLWPAAHQAPLSMGPFRQEHRSRLPFPSTEILPDPGIKPASPVSPALQVDSLPAIKETQQKGNCVASTLWFVLTTGCAVYLLMSPWLPFPTQTVVCPNPLPQTTPSPQPLYHGTDSGVSPNLSFLFM